MNFPALCRLLRMDFQYFRAIAQVQVDYSGRGIHDAAGPERYDELARACGKLGLENRRGSYHRLASARSREYACGVASSIGSKSAHNPVSASRKVGTPLSAETPAPVSTVMLALRSKS